MDKPRAPASPGPDSPEFEQRRAEGVSLYRQYQGFLADAASELQRALDSIDANVRRGTIAPEQAQSAELQARQSYDARLQEIEGGPTRSLVESEYEAQRDAARSAYDQRYGHVLGQTYELREAPSYGEPGYYRLYTSGRGEQMEEFVGREDPRASLPQFEFASSADEYWSALAGPAGTSGAGAPAAAPAQASARSRATGSSAANAVGVGRVYSWY